MDLQAIRQVFGGIQAGIRGLDGLLLITEEGLPLVSTLEAGEKESRSTAVGAILCDSGQRGVRELRLGDLDDVIVNGSDGYFVIRRIGGTVLMAVVSKDVPLGMVLLKIRKALPEIAKAVENA